MNWNLFSTWILIHFTLAFSARKEQDKDRICGKTANSNSFLWKMRRNPPVYFFGTIHVPHTRVWNHIPDNTKDAFYSSDNVVFELDLANENTIHKLHRCQSLPRGTKLHQVLPPDVYRRVKQQFDYVKRALPGWVVPEQEVGELRKKKMFASIVGNWKRKKPIWIMLMINSLTEAEMRSRGTLVLDHYLAFQAKRLGKQVGAIESVDEQCQPLDGLNENQVFIALNHTLMIQERLRQGEIQHFFTTDDLIKQYICGKLNLVTSKNRSNQDRPSNSSSTFMSASFSRDGTKTEAESYLENELIYRRNKRMAKRIETLVDMNSNRSFFFAFGAGHFLGNNSVIELLRKDGFSIDHIKAKNFKRRSFKKSQKRSHFDRFSLWLQVQAWTGDVNQYGSRNQKYSGKRSRPHRSRRNKLARKSRPINRVYRKRNLRMGAHERTYNQTSSAEKKEHSNFLTRQSHTFAGNSRPQIRVADVNSKRFSSHFKDYEKSKEKSIRYLESVKKEWAKSTLKGKHHKLHLNERTYRFPPPEKGISIEIWAELLPQKIKSNKSTSSSKCQDRFLLCVLMAMLSLLTMHVNVSYWFDILKLDGREQHTKAYRSQKNTVNGKQCSLLNTKNFKPLFRQ